MRIIWSPLAVARIEEISDYIALDNIEASIKWVEDVFQLVDNLRDYPESGRVVPEIDKESIREIIFGNYRIVYNVDIEIISILTVRNFKQILPPEDVN
ncbi:type II toxin-antitoxin system RelE/ParE family toxin [bacterium]|nr:type II toxin-antitoxin system RelE/ParE family toxin [bacterium]